MVIEKQRSTLDSRYSPTVGLHSNRNGGTCSMGITGHKRGIFRIENK